MELKTIIIIILIIGIICLGSYCTFKDSETIEVLPEAKAILDIKYIGWYENEYNSNEMFFDYWLVNYGDIEGKNIKVKCNVEDLNEEIIFSEIDSARNVASNSYSYIEFVTNNLKVDNSKEYYSYCFVESCDNCEILWKKIPELKEEYES